MLNYSTVQLSVYLEPTVISYLVARPSDNPILAARQKASWQLWEDYADRFEFVVSEIVNNEIRAGDPTAAQKRLEVVSLLTILDISPEADRLVQRLIDSGAVPRNSVPDAQHIATATVHGVEYLVSWNHKHIVNQHKRDHINQVCRAAGFQPTTLCTPIELMEATQMKEKPEKHEPFDPETYTDPILEECYRIKAEISARFKTQAEFSAYLKSQEEEGKRNGVKYVSYFQPDKQRPTEEPENEE